MTAPNVNGPRPGTTTGRMRNTATNKASKQKVYPTSVTRRPAPPASAATANEKGGLVTPAKGKVMDPAKALAAVKSQKSRVPGTTSGSTVPGVSAGSFGGAAGALGAATSAMSAAVQAMAMQGKYSGKQGSPGASGGHVPSKPGQTVDMGQQLARARYGWSGQDWKSLYKLWQGESGWNANAANPTSSARGIPQAMMSVHFGENWQHNAAAQRYLNNPRVQIIWGLRYIKGKYGSPTAALRYKEAHGYY